MTKRKKNNQGLTEAGKKVYHLFYKLPEDAPNRTSASHKIYTEWVNFRNPDEFLDSRMVAATDDELATLTYLQEKGDDILTSLMEYKIEEAITNPEVLDSTRIKKHREEFNKVIEIQRQNFQFDFETFVQLTPFREEFFQIELTGVEDILNPKTEIRNYYSETISNVANTTSLRFIKWMSLCIINGRELFLLNNPLNFISQAYLTTRALMEYRKYLRGRSEKKSKDHSIVIKDFRLKDNVKTEALSDVYDLLINERLVAKCKNHFINIFTSQPSNDKVNWLGNEKELFYFLLVMLECVLQKPAQLSDDFVVENFYEYTGRERRKFSFWLNPLIEKKFQINNANIDMEKLKQEKDSLKKLLSDVEHSDHTKKKKNRVTIEHEKMKRIVEAIRTKGSRD